MAKITLIEALTKESSDYLKAKVTLAFDARYNRNLPATVKLTSPRADKNVLGRVHFNVKKGNKIIGKATFKPRHRSVWVNWK